jgi:uncharacterized membrane protein YeaQ/YmgE (transglycosylase-associated protein family)
MTMIAFLVWIAMGALVGWVASLIMKTDSQQGALLNIIVGIVGAALGGALFRMFGAQGLNINDNQVSVYSFVVSLVGAIAVIALVKVVRRLVTPGPGRV